MSNKKNYWQKGERKKTGLTPGNGRNHNIVSESKNNNRINGKIPNKNHGYGTRDFVPRPNKLIEKPRGSSEGSIIDMICGSFCPPAQ
jgi:hypothetical protein